MPMRLIKMKKRADLHDESLDMYVRGKTTCLKKTAELGKMTQSTEQVCRKNCQRL